MVKPTSLSVGVESLGGTARGLTQSYLTASGCFEKEGFKFGAEGMRDAPTGAEVVHSGVALRDLDIGRVLGKGACSEVLEATHRPTETVYALKKFDVADEMRRKQLMTELRALGGPRCPSLVCLQDVFYERDTVYVMLEFMDAGSLENLIATRPPPSEAQSAAVLKQVAAGLFFLHKITKQVHRDLKPGNILLTKSGSVKLSDFGLTRQMEASAQADSFVGTLMYLSPERMKGETYGFEADIWSLGLIAYELVHRRHPYRGFSNRFIELVQTILESPCPTPDPELGYSDNFTDFLRGCMAKEPKERFSSVQLCDHKWLKGVGKEDVVASWIAE